MEYLAKPFIPGYYHTAHSEGYLDNINSPYQPDKSAGVDSIGMLMGSVSMAKIDGVYNIFNQDITAALDKFYKMEETAPGLDDNGYPIYYGVEGKSILDGTYRFTRADIEKSTVLVPDISFIRVGDILVRYDVLGEPHIGIVVGLAWEGSGDTPDWGDDARDWYNRVYVVSIRKGFQHTVLGTWGNRENMFGGFTDEPDK